MYFPGLQEVTFFTFVLSCLPEISHSAKTYYTVHPSSVGSGTILQSLSDATAVSCGRACSRDSLCNSANYYSSNKTCVMLQDGFKSSTDDPDGMFLVTSTEDSLWKFIGDTKNTFHPRSTNDEHGITYEAANASIPTSPRVLTFHGHIDSYLVLRNTDGYLALRSFTWAVLLFPQSLRPQGPLFTWTSDDTEDGLYGTHIFLLDTSYVYLRVCRDHDGSIPGNLLKSGIPTTVDAWNTVAVSYDSETGRVQIYVNGNVNSVIVGLRGEHSTHGDVVIGSRYHHSNGKDTRFLKGRMACMRLWSEARDLGTMFESTVLCEEATAIMP